MTDRRKFPKSPTRIRELYDLELIGRGPLATCSGGIWRMGQGNFFRCVECDYFMSDRTNESERCFCGKLDIDVSARRFGSALGDDQIEVWRATPRDAGQSQRA